MKKRIYKYIFSVIAVISLLCIITGCTSTKDTEKTTTSAGKTVSPAQSGKITDWYNKSNGEKTSSPSWLATLIYGDGSNFLASKNKQAGSQRFIVIAAGEANNLEDAQINATNDLQRAMSTQMYLVFSIAMKDFTQEQRKMLFDTCMKVDESVKATKEGSFWRKYDTTKGGKTTSSYTAYEFYSITQEEFNRQKELYLTRIFQMNDIFDRITLSQMITQMSNFTDIVENTSIKELSERMKEAWKRTIEDCNSKVLTSTQKAGINPLVKSLIAEYQ